MLCHCFLTPDLIPHEALEVSAIEDLNIDRLQRAMASLVGGDVERGVQ